MVPFFYCAVRYISDPPYLLGEKNSIETRRLRPRPQSPSFNVSSAAAAAKSNVEYGKQRSVQLVMPRNIKVGEEVFVDYAT